MTVIELITSIRQHKKASLAILVLALLLGKNCICTFRYVRCRNI